MNFTEACNACNKSTAVYYDGKACFIKYTTAGGFIRGEGIAEIYYVNETQIHHVNVEDLKL